MLSQGASNSNGGSHSLRKLHEPWIFARMIPMRAGWIGRGF